jgi:carboxypeptidase C (cathepsin A)
MKSNPLLVGLMLGAVLCLSAPLRAADDSSHDASHPAGPVDSVGREIPTHLLDESHITHSMISIAGAKLGFQAEAGLLVIYTKDPYEDDPPPPGDHGGSPPPARDEASMSYVAYFKGDKPDASRPITFIFNGGPGSSTVWLHMGAFGPRRVVTLDDTHTPAAPYKVVDNAYTLLDVSDLVFIDAPGTGFGVLRGADKEKAFQGTDADAQAFTSFIVRFLSTHGRWNSPKYLFGESYGTMRAALVAYQLENSKDVDLNGVIMLSQILSYDNTADFPQDNPGIDQPYVLSLPSFAATAFYHHALPNQPAQLEPFLTEVEQFAMGDYWSALAAGGNLPEPRKAAIAAKLHEYTGLPEDYLLRSDLRVNVGQFMKTLQGSETTTGRLDTRFSGPTIDPMSREADYDPQAAAIQSAYASVFNDYVRTTLGFGQNLTYKVEVDNRSWEFLHQPPDASQKQIFAANVMPDLADAMKMNPNLKVQLNTGYYDLATPFFEGMYEMAHLPIQERLRKNIEMHFYQSGHMVYAHEPSLKELHENVAAFIRSTH